MILDQAIFALIAVIIFTFAMMETLHFWGLLKRSGQLTYKKNKQK